MKVLTGKMREAFGFVVLRQVRGVDERANRHASPLGRIKHYGRRRHLGTNCQGWQIDATTKRARKNAADRKQRRAHR